ncbi:MULTISPECIES: hypothetical protein [unclassified Alistipes]|jgi:hypothetical protein|uniref:hypothetical protein n=1 Tax=unclassified Alistipes TaxID=2608932 RepID=UPI002586C06A|nr:MULTISPECIES: hypothetical protein [unclassified Alistipes]HUN14950.1 hypothetical protein [Alistipes sp.]
MEITNFDDPDFVDFLQELLIEQEPEEQDILRRVVDGGRAVYGALSNKEKHVFDEIVDMNTITNCDRCGIPIQWSEMIQVRNHGGYCSDCWDKKQTLESDD